MPIEIVHVVFSAIALLRFEIWLVLIDLLVRVRKVVPGEKKNGVSTAKC